MNLSGERIVLKMLTMNEVNDKYVSWINDSEVTKYMFARETTLPELEAYVINKINDHRCLFLGMFTKSNIHIGNIKIDPIDYKLKTGILGMMIGEKQYWNKGYGNEAIKLLLDHLFTDRKWNKIELGVHEEHAHAIRLYVKNGFKKVGNKGSCIWMCLKRSS